MAITLNIHIHTANEAEMLAALSNLKQLVISNNSKIDTLMSTVSDQLGAINAQLTKAFGEVNQKISDLETAIANNQDNLSPESQAALDALKATAQKLDDIVPDAPAPEPTV